MDKQIETQKPSKQMEMGLRLFLSLALQQAIESMHTEDSGVIADWMLENVASSATLLFPDPFDA